MIFVHSLLNTDCNFLACVQGLPFLFAGPEVVTSLVSCCPVGTRQTWSVLPEAFIPPTIHHTTIVQLKITPADLQLWLQLLPVLLKQDQGWQNFLLRSRQVREQAEALQRCKSDVCEAPNLMILGQWEKLLP